MSILVPIQDLAPSLPSRIVTLKFADMLEGLPEGETGWVEFELPGDLRVPDDQTVVKAGRKKVELSASSEGQIRLPVYAPAAVADSSDGEWALNVRKSWTRQVDAIRVPAGATSISLAEINPIKHVPPGLSQWLLTGASASGVEGAAWDVDVTTAGGIANFEFTFPPGGVAWAKGTLESTDLDMLSAPGVYRMSSANTYAGLPPFTRPGLASGFITVTNVPGNSWMMQEVVRYGNSHERWWRISTSTSGAWSPWVRSLGSDLVSLANIDVDTLTTTAAYSVNTVSDAATVTNLPVQDPGIFEHFRTGNGVTVQRFTTYGSAQAVWLRTSASVTSGTLGAWSDITAGAAGAADSGPYRHVDLLSRARMRRGGRIGTGGRGVVALRFDHHLEPFGAKVLPLLKQYNLPWAQALNPERTANATVDDNVPWATIQDWCLDSGGEIWNHGGNHGDASGTAALTAQIVTSLETLRANLPSLAVEGWCPPGLAAGGYGGASPFKTVEENTGTLAGRLIMGHHAFVAGYAPGVYRPLDVSAEQIGAPHVTLDQASLSSVETALDAAQDGGLGVALMLHPNYLDQAGYMTTAQLEAVFADIAARRDAGDLLVLSYSGLWAADSESMRRHDLAPAAQAPVTGTAAVTVTLPQYRHDQFLGAAREVVVDVTASAATSLTISVGGRAATTHQVQAGKSVVRRVVTLPADAAASIPVVVDPVASVTVNRVSCLAI